MRKNIFLFIALLSIYLFYSCNSASNKSEKFVGTWKSLQSGSSFTFTKSGESFLFSNITGTYPALYDTDHDKLVLNISEKHFDFIYDTKTKHLFFDGEEAEKVVIKEIAPPTKSESDQTSADSIKWR